MVTVSPPESFLCAGSDDFRFTVLRNREVFPTYGLSDAPYAKIVAHQLELLDEEALRDSVLRTSR